MKMPSYKNFQSDNAKYSRQESRTDIYNPAFVSFYKPDDKLTDSFSKNLDKWVQFASWSRWYPDLWYDLITPEMGSIRLDLDQRVFLRVLSRFVSTYGVFPRGYGKTLIEVMSMFHTCIHFADVQCSMTAQTKENATKILEDKYREIIRYWPMIKDEISDARFSKDNAEIVFTSGGRITTLANAQSSKGNRRHRLQVEEAAQCDESNFVDVLEPIVNVPRRTAGSGVVNPEELNGMINHLTTSWYKNTFAYERNLQYVSEMAELKGRIAIGSSWELAAHYGRGETKSQIMAKKEITSPIAFSMNYMSRWVGATDGALVNISDVLALRTLPRADLKYDSKSEFYISMDVARSESNANNQSAFVILKVKRNKDNRIIQISVPNIIALPNGLPFSQQAAIFKRLKLLYNARVAIVDANNMGKAIVDECLKDTSDPVTGDSMGCWDTINTEQEPEMADAEPCLFALVSQGIQHDILMSFISAVDSKKLKLLEKNSNNNYDPNDMDYLTSDVLPYLNTDLLIEEISNLRLVQGKSGKFGVEQITKRVDKDKFMALAYGIYYIMTYEDVYQPSSTETNINDYCLISNPFRNRKR